MKPLIRIKIKFLSRILQRHYYHCVSKECSKDTEDGHSSDIYDFPHGQLNIHHHNFEKPFTPTFKMHVETLVLLTYVKGLFYLIRRFRYRKDEYARYQKRH
ncbi:hypothetical protein CDAR_420561 [Caerostris darwini]|uniref:Uncharacterized protein n=1 Tax=Caerostris darwini TaxID=1538125 RepID=A0AAV4QHL7_9ARAC|nr:hypothetical protein CDAR_420561 [Caerostris darwini]